MSCEGTFASPFVLWHAFGGGTGDGKGIDVRPDGWPFVYHSERELGFRLTNATNDKRN